jgi:hypothetical protein
MTYRELPWLVRAAIWLTALTVVLPFLFLGAVALWVLVVPSYDSVVETIQQMKQIGVTK